MSEQQGGNGKGEAKRGGGRGGKPGAQSEQAVGEAEAVSGLDQAEGWQGASGRGAGAMVRAGWGRYLVAPCPVPLLAGGGPPIEASALFTLLEEGPEGGPLAQVRPTRAPRLRAIAQPPPPSPPAS